jgi:hypothetical protein
VPSALTPTAHPAAADAVPSRRDALRARASSLTSLHDPAARVAPTLALLAAAWEADADADARARWIRPLLPLLLDTDGDDDRGAALAAEARRADIAATATTTIASAIRDVSSGFDNLLAGVRRRPQGAAGGLLRRFDALAATFADLELSAQRAARQARTARAAATVASRPSVALADEQLAVQGRALGAPLVVRPDGAPPADASAAWQAAWSPVDPRPGAAALAAASAGQLVRLALRTPDIHVDALHAHVARAVVRMAGEGRADDERAALVALLAEGPFADLAPLVAGRAAPVAATAAPADDRPSTVVAPSDTAPAPRIAAPAVGAGGHAVAARYDAERALVVLTLASGVTVGVPTSMDPALAEAAPARLAVLQLDVDGGLLRWPELRVELPVRGLLRRALGAAL